MCIRDRASNDLRSQSNSEASKFNSFIGNTIELGWRAGGIGLFGGEGHIVKDNLIVNNFSGAGIRISTVFKEMCIRDRGRGV